MRRAGTDSARARRPGARAPTLVVRRGAASWSLALLCSFVSLAPYLPALANGFVWDDVLHVVDNPRIDTWRGVAGYFGSLEGLYHRPLIFLGYAAELRLWGRAPFGFHLTNLLLHALNTALLAMIGARLGRSRRASLLAAGLFALHPVQTEAVAYVSGRTDLLVACGSLLAWYALLAAPGALRRTVPVLAGTALAVLSKENGFALGPFLLWIGLRHRRALLPAAAGAAGAGLALLLRPGALPMAADGDGLLAAAAGVGAAVKTYALVLLWPAGLRIDRLTLLPAGAAPSLAGIAALLVSIAAGGWVVARRGAAADCVVWIVCFYLPAANLIPIYPAIADWALFTPEHNLYVPLAGLALLAGCGADVLWSGTPARESIGARHLVLAPRYGRVLQPIAAAVLLALAARTALRVLDWRDELTLFRSAAAAGSRSPRVHFNLGNLQLARGDLAAAAASFETAVRWEPRDGQAWGNLAVVRQRRGDVEGALAAYSNSLRLRPGAPAVWENLASLHIARGDLAAARRSLTAALRLDPTRAEARRALEALARLPER